MRQMRLRSHPGATATETTSPDPSSHSVPHGLSLSGTSFFFFFQFTDLALLGLVAARRIFSDHVNLSFWRTDSPGSTWAPGPGAQ